MDFCLENICNFRCYVVITYSIVQLWVLHDLTLTLRSQIFEYMRESFDGHASEYLQSARLEKKREKMLFSYGNAWSTSTYLKACGRWGHVVTTSNSPKP